MVKDRQTVKEIETCGLIMPISGIDGYSAEHWIEVKDIICECVNTAGFLPKLVSEASDTGIIHQRIIENIYANPILVCDISSRNPNVMFELGVRLTFDKPVVLIRDDETGRIFDTDIIEYLVYPKNLRYASIQLFKKELTDKITATYKKYKTPENSFFIKNFKNVKAQKLQDEELNSTQQILRAIAELKSPIGNITNVRNSSHDSIMMKITDDMLWETLRHTLQDKYLGDFHFLKSTEPTKIIEDLKRSFTKVILRNKYRVSSALLTERLENLYHLINDNHSLEEIETILTF